MKLGGINVIPDPRDVSWLNDSVNPAIVMGMPLTCILHEYSHPYSSHQVGTCLTLPLGHDADLGAIRLTLLSWEVSTALGRSMFQRWGCKILCKR
jgi:hypothetical protein